MAKKYRSHPCTPAAAMALKVSLREQLEHENAQRAQEKQERRNEHVYQAAKRMKRKKGWNPVST